MGIVKKKGKLAFRLRYYTLTLDGKLYSAKYNQTSKKKHVLDLGVEDTVLEVRETDLIVSGQNDQGFVNKILRYNNVYSTGYSSLFFSCILSDWDEMQPSFNHATLEGR